MANLRYFMGYVFPDLVETGLNLPQLRFTQSNWESNRAPELSTSYLSSAGHAQACVFCTRGVLMHFSRESMDSGTPWTKLKPEKKIESVGLGSSECSQWSQMVPNPTAALTMCGSKPFGRENWGIHIVVDYCRMTDGRYVGMVYFLGVPPLTGGLTKTHSGDLRLAPKNKPWPVKDCLPEFHLAGWSETLTK